MTISKKDVRRLAMDGWTVRKIAESLNADYRNVWRTLKRLGLPRLPDPEGHRRSLSLAYHRSVANGQPTGGERRVRHAKNRARLRGWPGAGSPEQCDLLDYLLAHGPCTARTVLTAFGYRLEAGQGGAGNSSFYRIFRKLKRAGLVAKVGSAGKAPLYAVAVAKQPMKRRAS